jgi:hypothetical protein
VQRLERQPANGTFGVGPHGREILAWRDHFTKRRSGIRRWKSASSLASECGERVFHSVEEELFDGTQLRLVRRRGDQSRAFQTLE